MRSSGQLLAGIVAGMLILGLLAFNRQPDVNASEAVSDAAYVGLTAGVPTPDLVQGFAAAPAAADQDATPTPTTPPSGPNPDWRLAVDGLVQSPLNLTFDDLAAMPATTVHAQLICVGWPMGALEEGDWTGVRLGLLLEEAGVDPAAVKVAFYAEDGFTTDLTVTTAMRGDIILAYERDGEPLWEKTRLVVPGKWGYKWIRGLVRIELVDYDFKGRYESMGYSDEGDIPGFTPQPTPTPTPPLAVGGIVEVRQETAPLSTDRSSGEAAPVLALAGGLSAAAFALAAGTWHVRRRRGG